MAVRFQFDSNLDPANWTKYGTGAGIHRMRPVEDFFIPMVKHPTEFPAEITAFLEYCRENLQLSFKDKIRSIFLTVRLPLKFLLPRSSSQGLSRNVTKSSLF